MKNCNIVSNISRSKTRMEFNCQSFGWKLSRSLLSLSGSRAGPTHLARNGGQVCCVSGLQKVMPLVVCSGTGNAVNLFLGLRLNGLFAEQTSAGAAKQCLSDLWIKRTSSFLSPSLPLRLRQTTFREKERAREKSQSVFSLHSQLPVDFVSSQLVSLRFVWPLKVHLF